MIASILTFALTFFLGRIGSIALYQFTWSNGKSRPFHPLGSLVTFLRKPWLWLLHIPILGMSASLEWQSLPHLRFYIWIAAGSFSMAAIGRMGAFDIDRFFIFDRCLILIFWLGLWVSPIFLYPLLLTSCCLQYIVSGSPLNPGYSNLLGFEFMRSSLCIGLAALLVHAILRLIQMEPMVYGNVREAETQMIALVLCGQAAGYVQQALAKCALGKKWYSWILENRLHCLFVNAYLRGWGNSWVTKEWVLRFAQRISRIRILLCGVAWLLEISWLLVFMNHRFTMGLLICIILFHLVVWMLTGLAGYHYAISHLLMLILMAPSSDFVGFNADYGWISAGLIACSSVWVLLLRRKLFQAYVSNGNAGSWGYLADPADHLMSWWDGPFMRLYSYSVRTTSGGRFHFPVTRFSPYDTFLTDIHTHLMILGQEWGLDPYLKEDRCNFPTGVWGLTVSLEDRDYLYRLMDDPKINRNTDFTELRFGKPVDSSLSLEFWKANKDSDSRLALIDFFLGLNKYQLKWWFRLLLFWPHFPGEDWVPDQSPLAQERLPSFLGSEPVLEVTVNCIKTFYDSKQIYCVTERVVDRICIPEDTLKYSPK